MTNNVTVQQPTTTVKPHALYDGVVFVVWAFGVYILSCSVRKIVTSFGDIKINIK